MVAASLGLPSARDVSSGAGAGGPKGSQRFSTEVNELRKLLRLTAQGILTIWVTITIVFAVTSLAGDPVALMLDPFATVERREQVRENLGLDKPIVERYGAWLGEIAHGNLGYSQHFRRPVATMIRERLPRSLLLGGVALVGAVLLAVPLGLITAVRRGSKVDKGIRSLAVIGQAAPSFWVGAMLILIFSVRLKLLPVTTAGLGGSVGGPQYWILPAITLGGFLFVAILRLIRSGMIEALASEHVKLARLQGVPRWRIHWFHALPAASVSSLSFVGQFIGLAVTVAIVTEKIFAWPGIGLFGFEAILAREVASIMGFVLVSTTLVIFMNLIVDGLYEVLDPRLRQQ